jgi:hypothetical protein
MIKFRTSSIALAIISAIDEARNQNTYAPYAAYHF